MSRLVESTKINTLKWKDPYSEMKHNPAIELKESPAFCSNKYRAYLLNLKSLIGTHSNQMTKKIVANQPISESLVYSSLRNQLPMNFKPLMKGKSFQFQFLLFLQPKAIFEIQKSTE
mgnify:FL=1